MLERPKIISKLATFIQDKEPLIYLFIINSDFILDDKHEVLPEYGLAGVTVRNKRIIFYYSSRVLDLPANKLYFLVIHEAFHIFKKHLDRFKDLYEEDDLLLNVAQDMVINEEILNIHNSDYSNSLVPEKIEPGAFLPDEFKNTYRDLDKDAYTTRRVYTWLKEKSMPKKEDFLKKDDYVRITGTDIYGKIKESRPNNDDEYEVDKMSKEEMINDINGVPSKNRKEDRETFGKNQLTPVIPSSKVRGNGGRKNPFDFEVIEGMDTHINDENDDTDTEVEQEFLTKKLFEKAKEMQAQINKRAGNNKGGFFSSIEELYNKSKINWRKEFNRKLNIYYSNNCKLKGIKDSFITYPWNPKSRYGILCKHTIEKIINTQKYIILAIDTSGSVFYDKNELMTFFTEIEAMAKWLNFTHEGLVLTIQWDTQISEGLKIYEKGDWKKYKVKGGGGTMPQIVFEYIKSIYKEKNNCYIVRENGVYFNIPNKKKLPYLLFLTDGYFFNKLTKKDLGIYKESINNVCFLTKSTDYLFKEANRIIYTN